MKKDSKPYVLPKNLRNLSAFMTEDLLCRDFCLSLLSTKRIKGMKIKTFVLCAMLAVPAGMWAQEMLNEVINTIMARRSVRKYQVKPVEHAKLETIAKCGINAPNGMNSQKWEVRVVEDPEFIEGTTALFVKDNPDMAKRDKNFKNMYRNAPNIICIGTPGGEASVDAGLLGENIILAAQSLGLGTCCLGGPVRYLNTSEAAKPYVERLAFSEGYSLCYIIAVGYPDETPEARPRDESKIVYIK